MIQTRIDERVVVGLWERQQIPAAALKPLALKVIFRGVPSDAGGPDYQDAVVSVGNKRVLTGDVEFHVAAGDWYRHGHHLNPRYNRVILHVVWTDDTGETRTENDLAVPVVALERYEHLCLTAPDHELTPRIATHPCVTAFKALPTTVLMDEVRRLGVERFNARSHRFTADLSIELPDQVAYGALLEGLGYASNRRAFARLADAVPYLWLQSLPPQERLPTLLDAARLGPTAPVAPPAHLPVGAWRLAMLRPANHPARRLQGLVALLDRFSPSLVAGLTAAVSSSVRASDLRKALVARDGADTFIGPGRADELIVSVVLPLVAALDPTNQKAADLFAHYPSPPANRWTHHMLDLLQTAGHGVASVRTAPEHQGLHHLYHSYCRGGSSATCTVCRMAGLTSQS